MMMELYLSPNGRIDQPTYWRAVLVLFGISVAISVISAFVNPFLGLLGIVFAWPWIAVHVKRFHDAGKSGWMTLLMVLVAIIASLILGAILPALFGIDQAALQLEMQREIEAASGDPAEALSVMMDSMKRASQAQLLPGALSTLIVTGVLGFIMSLFKSDPNDNQYGPAPDGPGPSFT